MCRTPPNARPAIRSYIGVFQRSSNPLKTACVRRFLFEGADLLPMLVEAIPPYPCFAFPFFSWGSTTLSSEQPVFPPLFLSVSADIYRFERDHAID